MSGPSNAAHVPVLRDRVVQLLRIETGAGLLIDATLGAGGHAAALLEASAPGVHLCGFDRDPRALALAEQRLSQHRDRVTLTHAGYDEMADRVTGLVATHGPVLGVLYDLGLSSMQLDESGRGFAFRVDDPLDMRMDPTSDEPDAATLVNSLETAALADLLFEYGEERHARHIARAIVLARPIRTTVELADVVRGAVPPVVRHGRTHPATKTFQALRIAVNAELDRFSASLPQALDLLQPALTASDAEHPRGGRAVVLSYHSLEDRIAKRVFADAMAGCVCPPDLPVCVCGREPWIRDLVHGIERPDESEITANARARSAKLRAVEKIAPTPEYF